MGALDNNWHGWQIFLISAIPSSIAWLFGAWQYFLNRKDVIKKENMTSQEKMQLELNEQRKTLTADQGMLFERVRTEWQRCVIRIDALERERDRAWDLVRYWYRYCESLLHQLRNTRFVAEGLAQRAQPPIELSPFLFSEPLPDMENPERSTPPPPGTAGRGQGTPPPGPLEEPMN